MIQRSKYILFSVSSLVLLSIIAFGVVYYVKQKAAYKRRSICVGNLIDLNMAKRIASDDLGLTNGQIIPMQVVRKYQQRRNSICPDGGAYLVNVAGKAPECTYTGVCYTWHVVKDFPFLKSVEWNHNYFHE